MKPEFIKDSIDSFLSQQDFGDEIPDYKTVENSIALLERMAEVENSSIAVFDLYKKEFISIRSKYKEYVNADLEEAQKYGPAYYISIMHPDDGPVVLDWQSLSARELEVLGLVSKGFISKEIADKLFISVNTVNNHRQNILEKIKAANTNEAIRYARNLGLL